MKIKENILVKNNYDVEPILDAFKEVKQYFGESFRYKVSTYFNGYHSAIIDCYLNGNQKQFAFASMESEPTLKENEYWLVFYYELPSKSSIPHRGNKSKLKTNLISLLENKMNAFYI